MPTELFQEWIQKRETERKLAREARILDKLAAPQKSCGDTTESRNRP